MAGLGEEILCLGVLAVGAVAVLVNEIRKVECYICNKKYSNGDMKKINSIIQSHFCALNWPPDSNQPQTLDIIINTKNMMGIDTDRATHDKIMSEIGNKKFDDKKICSKCNDSMGELLKQEADTQKACCPGPCVHNDDEKWWENELDKPDKKIPEFWLEKRGYKGKVCYRCRQSIHDRYLSEGEESLKHVKCYGVNDPDSWKADVDFSAQIKSRVESNNYCGDRNEAVKELQLRAYVEGYEIVFDYDWNNHSHGQWSAIGCLGMLKKV